MSQLVKVEELDEGIVKVTIDRPDALNALNAEVLSALLDAVTPLRAQPDARVVVFTGEGRAFVAGADIRAMSEMSEAEAAEFSKLGHDAFNAIASLPMPTIAAVNGFALGGGLELALSCDLIYASTKAKLGLPEVGLGLIPGFGGTQRLGRRIGYQRARELVFTGGTIRADEAERIGLALRLFEPDALLEGVYEIARTIASKGPRAVRAAKEVMDKGRHATLHDALATERGAFSGLFNSDEPAEGMRAFVEKRAPDF